MYEYSSLRYKVQINQKNDLQILPCELLETNKIDAYWYRNSKICINGYRNIHIVSFPIYAQCWCRVFRKCHNVVIMERKITRKMPVCRPTSIVLLCTRPGQNVFVFISIRIHFWKYSYSYSNTFVKNAKYSYSNTFQKYSYSWILWWMHLIFFTFCWIFFTLYCQVLDTNMKFGCLSLCA